ncbi:hypothetical protein Tco_1197168, partial [Tanacetum coccineum]
MRIKGFLRCMLDAESQITCDNTNENTTLSEAHRVSLRITTSMRVSMYRNRLEKGIAHKPVIVEVFHDLRGDYRVVYHDLSLGGPTAKDVGLRVASSHTGTHREDDFTPLETIPRFLGNDDTQTIMRSFLIGKCQTSMRLGKATLPNRPLSWLGSRTQNVNAAVAGSRTMLFDLLQ